MSVESYSKKFQKIKPASKAGHTSPHKMCMLFAMIDLFESGIQHDNRVYFDERLLTRYAAYFNAVKTDQDHLNPWMPFFHLRSSGFWHHQPMAGREAQLSALRTAVRKGDVVENIEYVYLDDALYGLMQSDVDRDVLRETLLLRWFPDHIDALSELFGVTAYERILRGEHEAQEVKETANPARSAAFRRMVVEAYDYRCAANGWRIVLPDYAVLVEAAHIVPFSETFDDRPQNGIALTPTFHAALDRNLIAPGPDMKWHVSSQLDDRLPDNQPILELAGRDLILPRDVAMRPDENALAWRLQKLI